MAYSKEERERIIQYHLTSGNSLSRTSKEFGIGGSMTLAKWLKNFEESKKKQYICSRNQSYRCYAREE